MAIPDGELTTEITTDPTGLGFEGAGARPITSLLTAEGSASVETWVVSSISKMIERNLFINTLTDTEAAAFLDLIEGASEAGKALRLQWTYSTSSIDMAATNNRDKITNVGFLAQGTKDTLLRFGEVRQSRSQELWGEQVTIDQVKGVL